MVEGPNPKNAAQLVNAVVDGYFELLERLKVDRQQRVIELLDQERERLGSQVETLRQRMHALGKEILGKDPFTGTPTAEAATKHPLAVVHDRLIAAEVEAKVLEVQVQAFEESLAKGEVSLSEAMIEAAIDQSPEVQDTQTLLATKRATLERIETTAKSGKEDPSFRRLSDEIADYEDSLRRMRETVRPRVTGALKARAELERADELKQLRSQLTAQKVLEQMLSERYAQQLKELGVTGERSLDLEFTRAALAREERVYELIADRVMALRTEIRAPGRVIPMQRATPPDRPAQAFPLQAWAIAFLASLGLPLVASVLWEVRVCRITTSRQLEQMPNLPLLAEVPRLPLRTAQWRRSGSAQRPSRGRSSRRASTASARAWCCPRASGPFRFSRSPARFRMKARPVWRRSWSSASREPTAS